MNENAQGAKPRSGAAYGFDETREHLHRQMLSAVSHDLKTPLATIIGSLEIYKRMEQKLPPEKKLMLIDSALQEGYRLDGFVTNILDMAKLEGGMVKIRNERFEVATMLRDCITRLGPKGETGKFHLRETAAPAYASTDPMLLGRAVGILLDNAIKYGGRPPQVTIEYGERDRHNYIYVRDNGPGIAAGKAEEIFSKYTRFATSDQQNAGTGLGLAICRLIMQLLSGSVQVINTAAGGAEFRLLFPALM